MMQSLKGEMKVSNLYHWDLLDEAGNHVVDHIVEDNDQRPSKEWFPVGLYYHVRAQDTGKVV